MTTLTTESLRELLHYDRDTGLFTWKVSKKGPGAKAGMVAGWTRPDGYVCLKVCQQKLFAHRLAWLFEYGCLPTFNLDHIDGNPSNNRISNLRDVPQQLNVHNIRRDKSGKTSGLPRGVKHNGRGFSAQIRVVGKTRYLGQFKTADEAHRAYQSARASLHAGFVA